MDLLRHELLRPMGFEKLIAWNRSLQNNHWTQEPMHEKIPSLGYTLAGTVTHESPDEFAFGDLQFAGGGRAAPLLAPCRAFRWGPRRNGTSSPLCHPTWNCGHWFEESKNTRSTEKSAMPNGGDFGLEMVAPLELFYLNRNFAQDLQGRGKERQA